MPGPREQFAQPRRRVARRAGSGPGSGPDPTRCPPEHGDPKRRCLHEIPLDRFADSTLTSAAPIWSVQKGLSTDNVRSIRKGAYMYRTVERRRFELPASSVRGNPGPSQASVYSRTPVRLRTLLYISARVRCHQRGLVSWGQTSHASDRSRPSADYASLPCRHRNPRSRTGDAFRCFSVGLQ